MRYPHCSLLITNSDAALKRMPVAEALFARILEHLNIQVNQIQDYTKLLAKSIDQAQYLPTLQQSLRPAMSD